MNPLRDLIREQMRHMGWSYEQVEDRARARGAPVSKSTIHALATKGALTRAPTRETLQGLSAGLGIALEIVQQAALRSLGWNLETTLTEDEERHVASWRELSERDKRTIQRMVEELRRNGDE